MALHNICMMMMIVFITILSPLTLFSESPQLLFQRTLSAFGLHADKQSCSQFDWHFCSLLAHFSDFVSFTTEFLLKQHYGLFSSTALIISVFVFQVACTFFCTVNCLPHVWLTTQFACLLSKVCSQTLSLHFFHWWDRPSLLVMMF